MDIVDQSVGKIPSVVGSILVSESEDMVHGVGVDLAIASSVLGCMVRVRRMLGCGSRGIVYGELAVVGGGFISRCGWGWHVGMLSVNWAEADLVSVMIALGSKLVIELLQLWTVPKLL